MSDDLSLFGDDDPAQPSPAANSPAPITDWQVDLLRKSLDARGLTTMAERQQAIESSAGRAVESLRELTHEEALSVLNRLGRAFPAMKASGASAWDDRDGATWIDRL